VIFVTGPEYVVNEHGEVITEELAQTNQDTDAQQVFVVLGTYDSEE
jgi:hypothetical protein